MKGAYPHQPRHSEDVQKEAISYRYPSYIRPKGGELLPMHLPQDEVITLTDVHLGDSYIWTGMKGVLFCDIDGTIADLAHRRVYVASKPKNWPAFERTMNLDTPIQNIIDAVNALHAAGWTVVMCTGRGAQNRDITIEWLNKHGVKFDKLYTRARYEIDPETGDPVLSKKGSPKGDYRRDDIVKEELLMQARADGFDPDVVFDDRDQVVRMWRRVGVPCIQVAEGDF